MAKNPLSSLVRPSTRSWIQEAKQTPDFSLFDLLHGYVYARWPYLYIGIGTGEHPLAKKLAPVIQRIGWLITRTAGRSKARPGGSAQPQGNQGTVTFADTYHGKVVPLDAARQLVRVNEPLRVPDLEHIIPYSRARAIVLHNPDHIVALDCPCRASRANPCLPLDVCLIVGEPFASFVVEHHPQRSRWITPGEAEDILRAEDERGHVHHAFFKDAMLGRFYAICNCCACCCGAMQAQRSGTPMLASSGYVAQVDEQECIGCANCVSYCQFGALSNDGQVTRVDPALCMGCGICLSKCEQGALSLRREESKGEPLEIFTLMEQATPQAIP